MVQTGQQKDWRGPSSMSNTKEFIDKYQLGKAEVTNDFFVTTY